MHASLPLVGISKDKLKEIFDKADRHMNMSSEEFWREQRLEKGSSQGRYQGIPFTLTNSDVNWRPPSTQK